MAIRRDSFDTIYRGFTAAVAQLAPVERRQLMAENARRIHRL